jgi:hypothetical protein
MSFQENKNITDLTVEEMANINGGQCDCEDGGRGAAKAVKSFFNSLWSFGRSAAEAMSDGISTFRESGGVR